MAFTVKLLNIMRKKFLFPDLHISIYRNVFSNFVFYMHKYNITDVLSKQLAKVCDPEAFRLKVTCFDSMDGSKHLELLISQ